jgi:hypothetical protein
MPNLGVTQLLHPYPTMHADPPSGGSTRTEPDIQRHPYTNKAKEPLKPNSKIPTQTQKWATHHFGAQPLPIPPYRHRHFISTKLYSVISNKGYPTYSPHTITSQHPCRSPNWRINMDAASHPTPPRTQIKIKRTSYVKLIIPTQTQKWATDNFGAHFLGRCKISTQFFFFWARENCPSSRAIPILYTRNVQAGPILNLKSRSPLGGAGGALTSTATPTPILPILASSLIADVIAGGARGQRILPAGTPASHGKLRGRWKSSPQEPNVTQTYLT